MEAQTSSHSFDIGSHFDYHFLSGIYSHHGDIADFDICSHFHGNMVLDLGYHSGESVEFGIGS